MIMDLFQKYDISTCESCDDWSDCSTCESCDDWREDESAEWDFPAQSCDKKTKVIRLSYPDKESKFSISPYDLMKSLLLSQGIETKTSPSLSFKDFFLEVADRNVLAYEMDVVDAFRSKNFDRIKAFHKQGKFLQCCNKFGESVVHLICRLGSYDILSFLVSEANVSIRVRDDWGRTALHDACWSNKPNFDLVKFLLKECPDLLIMRDGRGFTPLDYIPQNLWGEWCEFLEENENMLKPKYIVGVSTFQESENKSNKKRKRE